METMRAKAKLDVRATPNAFNRRAQPPETLAQSLGPLQTLVNGNQWVGDTGFNLMVVPNPQSQFIVMVSPIFETHIFAAVPAPVPNRTISNGTEQVGAVKYSQIVAENVSKNILHEETGMWLNQTVGSGDSDPEFGLGAVEGTLPNGTDATALVNQFPIVRSGTIPHGNTIHATGAWTDSGAVAPFSGGIQPFISVSNSQNDGTNLQFLPLFAGGSELPRLTQTAPFFLPLWAPPAGAYRPMTGKPS